MGIVYSMILAIFSMLVVSPAQGVIVSTTPEGRVQFEHVYGHEPTDAELNSIRSLREKYGGQIEYAETLEDLKQKILKSSDQLFIIIGHNSKGDFRFPSGESIQLDLLSGFFETSDKIPVFLTCRGSCYIDAPAPGRKMKMSHAFALAEDLSDRFGNFNVSEVRSTFPVEDEFTSQMSNLLGKNMTIEAGQLSKTKLPRDRCAELLMGILSGRTGTANGASAELVGELRKAIFRAEVIGIIPAGVKVTVTGGAVAGAVYVSIHE